MKRLICIIGNKGGTGKTTMTHMLCHGLGLLGKRSLAVMTDPQRESLARGTRRYTPMDGRSPATFKKMTSLIESMPNWIGVIDGGGNRPEQDRAFYELCELVLLPFRDSHEDIRTVKKDLDAFPRAFGVPSQWPTNPWQQLAAERTLDELMQAYRPRLLEPVYSVSASKHLLEERLPASLPSVLNNVCRNLATQVLERLDGA